MDPERWLLAGLVAALSALGTELARRYARRRALIDQPGPRRSHAAATPRGGGFGPVLAVTAALAGPLAAAPAAPAIAAAWLLVAGVGAWDDHRPLPAWPRLLAHALAGLILATVLLGGWSGIPSALPSALVWLGLALALTAAVNVCNFMDGSDALAASQAALILLALALWPGLAIADPFWRGLCLLAGAAVLGFLPFNLPPAKVFLGDVGSGALGLLVGAALAAAVLVDDLPWPLALLPPSAFVVDAGLTLAGRIGRGESWWQPHRQHLYQWAIRAGHGHGTVALAYGLWTLAMLALAAALRPAGATTILAAAIGAAIAAAILWRAFRDRFRRQARRRSA